jgi:hypothetical protein
MNLIQRVKRYKGIYDLEFMVPGKFHNVLASDAMNSGLRTGMAHYTREFEVGPLHSVSHTLCVFRCENIVLL